MHLGWFLFDLFWRGWGGKSLEFRSSGLVSRSGVMHVIYLGKRRGGCIYRERFSQRNTANVRLLQLSCLCVWNGGWVPPVWHWNGKSVSDAQSKFPQSDCARAASSASSPRGRPAPLPGGSHGRAGRWDQGWFFFVNNAPSLAAPWQFMEGKSFLEGPCLRAKPLFPLEQAPASALPAPGFGKPEQR